MTSQAYAEMRGRVLEALKGVPAHGDPDDLQYYVDAVMQALVGVGPDVLHEAQWGAWMIDAGQVHKIIETDFQDRNGESTTWQVWTEGEVEDYD